MIRLVLVVLFLFVFLVLSLPIQLVVWLLSFKWPKAPDYVSYPLVSWAFRVVMWISGVKLTVLGRENIDPGVPCMYAGNHRGFFDVVVTYTLVRRPCGYLAKDSFKKIPGLNIWMTLMHCLFLDRNNIKQGLQCIIKCIDLVKQGISVFVYPEGTRSKEPDKFLEFHDASFKIALKSGCPIVPVAINRTDDVFENNNHRALKKTHVVVEFLPAIHLEDLDSEDKKHLGSYTKAIIEEAYFKNKELAYSK